jgi:hypothetical protein
MDNHNRSAASSHISSNAVAPIATNKDDLEIKKRLQALTINSSPSDFKSSREKELDKEPNLLILESPHSPKTKRKKHRTSAEIEKQRQERSSRQLEEQFESILFPASPNSPHGNESKSSRKLFFGSFGNRNSAGSSMKDAPPISSPEQPQSSHPRPKSTIDSTIMSSRPKSIIETTIMTEIRTSASSVGKRGSAYLTSSQQMMGNSGLFFQDDNDDSLSKQSKRVSGAELAKVFNTSAAAVLETTDNSPKEPKASVKKTGMFGKLFQK